VNITARAARWSAANWKKATFGWLAFVIVSAALGQAVGAVKLTQSEQGSGESARAQATLRRAGLDQSADETVLVHSAMLTAGEPQFQRVVRRVASGVAALEMATRSRRTDTRPSFSSQYEGALKQPLIASSR